MSVDACAALVERADPDRLLAAMAAPPEARRVLFPIYAANAEIARAPYAATEPLIAEMRLQWWRDVMEEIAAGEGVRRHEVTTPLAEVLPPAGARLMSAVADARSWDVSGAPFADEDALVRHLDATAGCMTWASAIALGADSAEEISVRGEATAGGIAAWLRAVPAYRERGREPLPDASDAGIAALARRGLDLIGGRRRGAAKAALLWTWQARAILGQAAADPSRVAAGALGTSEFRRRGGLLLRAL